MAAAIQLRITAGHVGQPDIAYGPDLDKVTCLDRVTATDEDPERLITPYACRRCTGYCGLPRSAAIPPITEFQVEALDTLLFLAEMLAVSLDFDKGDMRYVNNLSIFHARGGFKDPTEKKTATQLSE
ncbi:uncharacterized protein BKA55DRAFT_692833 [Fusarium redolens]|uniref:TauD/TfdA-like domain-containing protein n=1 Tax=Fusarium redolens TaxID=48865 RepID=A0A9P9JZN5_FUSRE|nr:uncharacterized protein BKA55DRAFT_692833 [Fusarium redolens]KAH7243672.1 hypothetical protein BKA55DRAFT_692833 [Fusarium redolens]